VKELRKRISSVMKVSALALVLAEVGVEREVVAVAVAALVAEIAVAVVERAVA